MNLYTTHFAMNRNFTYKLDLIFVRIIFYSIPYLHKTYPTMGMKEISILTSHLHSLKL